MVHMLKLSEAVVGISHASRDVSSLYLSSKRENMEVCNTKRILY